MSVGAARSTAAKDDAASRVDELVAGLGSSQPTLVAVPAPLVAIERAAAAIDDFGAVLGTSEGDAVVALSAHAILPLDIDGAELAARLRGLARRPSLVAPFATFAMRFDASRVASCETLEPSGFVIPRVAYVVRRGRAYVVAAGIASDADAVRSEARRLFACLGEPVHPARGYVENVVDADDDRFRSSVESALAAIADDGVDKVVLARRVRARISEPVVAAEILAELAESAPSTHRFALVRKDGVFVGATPERLVSCREGRVSTEALAGTKRRGESDELVSSTKDRAEQRWVLDAIRDALAPFVETLRVDAEPRPRELRDLVHLATTFDGPLRDGKSVLDVLRVLHPTPAVGGVPRERAIEHIRAAEPFDRGHYAAPFGWIDANGDADVVVALRCGLFRGAVVDLYAGAGIVEGSTATLELEETDLKLRALLSVLDGDTD